MSAFRFDGKKRTVPSLEGGAPKRTGPRSHKDHNPFLGTTIPAGQPPESKWAHPKEVEFRDWWYAYVEFDKLVGYEHENIKISPLPEPGGRWLLEAMGGPQGTLWFHFVWDKQRVHVDEMQQGWTEDGKFWLACPMDPAWAPYKPEEVVSEQAEGAKGGEEKEEGDKMGVDKA